MVGAIGAPKGGCLIVVATNKIVTEKLSVPHSLAERDLLARISKEPRLHHEMSTVFAAWMRVRSRLDSPLKYWTKRPS